GQAQRQHSAPLLTRVYLRSPSAEYQVVQIPPVRLPSVEPREQDTRVLLIDEDPAVHELARRFLEERAFHVLGARTVEEGLELAAEHAPSVIVLDVMTRAEHGWRGLQRLVEDPRTSATPVVLQSLALDRELGRRFGAAGYLPKPPERERLVRMMMRYRRGAKVAVVAVGHEGLRVRAKKWLGERGWTWAEVFVADELREWLDAPAVGLALLDVAHSQLDVLAALDGWSRRATGELRCMILGGDMSEESKRGLSASRVRSMVHEEGALEHELDVLMAPPGGVERSENASS
ncbi:MAG: response regulator, partial [Myxococcota bacterium]